MLMQLCKEVARKKDAGPGTVSFHSQDWRVALHCVCHEIIDAEKRPRVLYESVRESGAQAHMLMIMTTAARLDVIEHPTFV